MRTERPIVQTAKIYIPPDARIPDNGRIPVSGGGFPGVLSGPVLLRVPLPERPAPAVPVLHPFSTLPGILGLVHRPDPFFGPLLTLLPLKGLLYLSALPLGCLAFANFIKLGKQGLEVNRLYSHRAPALPPRPVLRTGLPG